MNTRFARCCQHLKLCLARGEIQFNVLGATYLGRVHRKSIEKDGALERRFQKVMVDPTTADETLQILEELYRMNMNITTMCGIRQKPSRHVCV